MVKSDTVFIIGAPRSGTNLLRDVLTSFEGLETWPCDEINYIWRHGNAQFASDELPVKKANNFVKRYIRKSFDKAKKLYKAKILIEKTCANSLRIPFVNSIFPNAIYIYIVRDGVDAAVSAKTKWASKKDFFYLLKKFRFVPLSDFPIYAWKFLKTRVLNFFSNKNLTYWGPSIGTNNKVIKNKSLVELCALQWQSCVVKSDKSFSTFNRNKFFYIRYEEFVKNPYIQTYKILNFIGIKVSEDDINNAVKNVSDKNIGKGYKSLSHSELQNIKKLLKYSLKKHEYI